MLQNGDLCFKNTVFYKMDSVIQNERKNETISLLQCDRRIRESARRSGSTFSSPCCYCCIVMNIYISVNDSST